MKQLEVTLVDFHGRRRTMRNGVLSWVTAGSSQCLDYIAALQSCTNSSIVEFDVRAKTVNGGATAAVAGPYSIFDKVRFVFKTAAGVFVSITLPAPVVAIFTNEEVVNAAHSLCVAIINAALAVLRDKTGAHVTDFVKAERVRPKHKQIAA